MLWKRKRADVAEETTGGESAPLSEEPAGENNLDQAVDTLAAVLRDFGQYAFELPDGTTSAFAELCDRWAAHVLYAASPPDEPHAAGAGGRRDWIGVRTFLAERRRRERAFVSDSLTGMQQVVLMFVGELNRSLLGEQEADQQLHSQLQSLRTAVVGNSIEEMRREVLAAVSEIGRIAEERREQQRLQMEALSARIQELNGQLEAARKESSLDPLTLLTNRKALEDHLARALELRTVFKEPACLFLIDADHFKSINDTYGHAAGDAVLRALADCLTSTFPRKGDCVARYGGEEFAVLYRSASLTDGLRAGERLLRAVRALRVDHAGADIAFTVSIGLADALPDDTASDWLERADRALYAAKQRGRDHLQTASEPTRKCA
jgi:diguanylate cyclase (GGDEF)-like protein